MLKSREHMCLTKWRTKLLLQMIQNGKIYSL